MGKKPKSGKMDVNFFTGLDTPREKEYQAVVEYDQEGWGVEKIKGVKAGTPRFRALARVLTRTMGEQITEQLYDE